MDASELDQFDKAILRVLVAEGRISITELAGRIGLSKSPTQSSLCMIAASIWFRSLSRRQY